MLVVQAVVAHRDRMQAVQALVDKDLQELPQLDQVEVVVELEALHLQVLQALLVQVGQDLIGKVLVHFTAAVAERVAVVAIAVTLMLQAAQAVAVQAVFLPQMVVLELQTLAVVGVGVVMALVIKVAA
jgi:hypothetical protein